MFKLKETATLKYQTASPMTLLQGVVPVVHQDFMLIILCSAPYFLSSASKPIIKVIVLLAPLDILFITIFVLRV